MTSQARHTTNALSDDWTAAKAVLYSLRWLQTCPAESGLAPLHSHTTAAAYRRLLALAYGFPWLAAMDRVHPSQATKITYGWIRTGKEKRIETTASRTRVNVLGAIELGNLSQAVTEKYDTINSESIASFFEVVRSQYNSSGTIHMILDGAGYNRSEASAKAAIKYNIELHPLPPYSPNLNPIERLWKVMNEKVRNNRFFKNTR